MEEFEKVLLNFNYPKRTSTPLTTIAHIEEKIKFKLPTDYINYLKSYLGFEEFIGKEFLRLWDFEEIIEINECYSVLSNLPNTLGIGGNGNDEIIAIELIELNNYRIILTPFTDLDEKYHIEIGTSFTNFLVRLENGQEWFKKKS